MAHNKFLPRVLAAAAAMMLLAGCSSKADPGFSPANPVNITIWTYYNGEQLEAFNALVDEFNSTVGKEQGITVESSSHGSVTDLENNVLASAGQGWCRGDAQHPLRLRRHCLRAR